MCSASRRGKEHLDLLPNAVTGRSWKHFTLEEGAMAAVSLSFQRSKSKICHGIYINDIKLAIENA
jgi:hypothetical protein